MMQSQGRASRISTLPKFCLPGRRRLEHQVELRPQVSLSGTWISADSREHKVIKVLCVFGTRPEAIKMAPVIKELRKYADKVISKVCVTAQHRQMLDQVLNLFEIKPDYDLNIMQDDQSLSYVTARVLTELERVIQKERPDWVLVQGDTTTTMAASLAAFYQRVKVGHVEAGLRTWDKFRPYPEEINRQIADAVCDLHFAPTERAKENLLREGVSEETILVTGNTVIDALLDVVSREFNFAGSPLESIPFDSRRVILVTAHRRENFGKPLENICEALLEIAERYNGDVHIVYPVHLNPHVQGPVYSMLGGVENISLIEPLDYQPFVHLMNKCHFVLTDSGGLQEEAPSLGKPVLVLREVTERPEAVEAGTVKLVGTRRERIVEGAVRLLEDNKEYERMARAVNPYGDGRASEKIVGALVGESVKPFEPAAMLRVEDSVQTAGR
jgi:UDP-N-acetylglucosamine 2-epimerase (non-hydrolysing)